MRQSRDIGSSWPAYSGYLDYIKDDRNKDYWRPYVGQTSNPAKRINKHFEAFKRAKNQPLHYFIASKGRGHRSMNVIRLWSLPNGDCINDGQSRILLSNILETVMCRAFQSLPRTVLQEFFGDQEFATTGLNIVPPLFQGFRLDVSKRQRYCISCLDSMDEQIREWSDGRRNQVKQCHWSLLLALSQHSSELFKIIVQSAKAIMRTISGKHHSTPIRSQKLVYEIKNNVTYIY